jgi:hypothetical protein
LYWIKDNSGLPYYIGNSFIMWNYFNVKSSKPQHLTGPDPGELPLFDAMFGTFVTCTARGTQ